MYGSHKKHSAGARNVKARAKRALLLPSMKISTVLFGEKTGLSCKFKELSPQLRNEMARHSTNFGDK